MKIVGVREAKATLSELLDRARTDAVVITHHGKPVAALRSLHGYDLEQVVVMADPQFWAMIEARRQEPTIPEAEARKRLGLPPVAGASGRRAGVAPRQGAPRAEAEARPRRRPPAGTRATRKATAPRAVARVGRAKR
jgi:prevent-host-death family protein